MIGRKPLIVGMAGMVALVTIFMMVVTLVNSPSAAFREFVRIWYWILFLAAGFGFQLGLYTYIRLCLRRSLKGATAEVTASGALSTGSMVACCSHIIANILPSQPPP